MCLLCNNRPFRKKNINPCLSHNHRSNMYYFIPKKIKGNNGLKKKKGKNGRKNERSYKR